MNCVLLTCSFGLTYHLTLDGEGGFVGMVEWLPDPIPNTEYEG